MSKSGKNIILTLAVSLLAGGSSAYFITKHLLSQAPEPTILQIQDGNSYRTVNLGASEYPDFTYAAETCVDAVVYVKVAVPVHATRPNSIFDFFLGGASGGTREQYGSGSGVIIRADGYIVTNNHVVGDASRIEVTLNNNQSYPARIIGTDPATDVAIIKIDADNLPTVAFADSDQLRLGEWVIAIGSPYDLRSTITAGIVSAKGRSMPNYSRELKIESFIQTDAAVNPGNSGGALVNKAGQLVGVNTAIISQTGSYAGYSFAIPSNMVHKIADDLIEFGTVQRAMLGVTVGNIDANMASQLKLSAPMGVYINEVQPGGPADRAGLRSGDVLISVNNVKVNSFATLQEAISQYRPGDSTELTVIRDGKETVLPLTF